MPTRLTKRIYVKAVSHAPTMPMTQEQLQRIAFLRHRNAVRPSGARCMPNKYDTQILVNKVKSKHGRTSTR